MRTCAYTCMRLHEPEEHIPESRSSVHWQEAKAERLRAFVRADSDRGGTLDEREFAAMVRREERREISDAEIARRFAALDADGSGKPKS